MYLSGAVTDDLMELHITVKNLTDKEIEVKVKKTEISLVENTVNTFCWGSCFMPTVYVSPVSIKIPAFGSDFSSIAGDFEPYGMEGTSIICYTFFNSQDDKDSVGVTSFYQVGSAGIPDIRINSNIVSIYPNPVVDQLTIHFQEVQEKPYSMRLLSLNGQVIKELISDSMARELSFTLGNLSASCAILEISNPDGLQIRRKVLISR